MEPRARSAAGHAVYGLNLVGIGTEGSVSAPPDWETWTVEQIVEAADDSEGMTVRTQTARVGLPGSGEIRIDRARREIVFARRTTLSAEALMHPGLVPAAAIVAWWQGRISLHASAVVVDGRVWGLVADREGGKSTTAALLAARGCPLFTDDMLIIDGATCYAGPSSVDLRSEAAERLGGKSLGVIGRRPRWRKELERPAIEAPLAGFVELAWSADGQPTVEELAPQDRLHALDRHLSLPVTGPQLLDLADRPMLRLCRPRRFPDADDGADVLVDAWQRGGVEATASSP